MDILARLVSCPVSSYLVAAINLTLRYSWMCLSLTMLIGSRPSVFLSHMANPFIENTFIGGRVGW